MPVNYFLLGPVGFVKDLSIWNSALSSGELFNQFSRGVGDVRAVDVALDLVNAPSHKDGGPIASGVSESPLLRRLRRDQSQSNPHQDFDEATLQIQQQLLREAEVARTTCSSKAAATTTESGDSLVAVGQQHTGAAPSPVSSPSPSPSPARSSYAHRLDLYAQAAELGSAEGLYHWAMMLAFGVEKGDVDCGIDNLAEVHTAVLIDTIVCCVVILVTMALCVGVDA
jgi:hypothetical protein